MGVRRGPAQSWCRPEGGTQPQPAHVCGSARCPPTEGAFLLSFRRKTVPRLAGVLPKSRRVQSAAGINPVKLGCLRFYGTSRYGTRS